MKTTAAHTLEVCKCNVTGKLSVYLNEHRLTGRDTKPVGYFETIASFTVPADNIKTGLKRGKRKV